MPSLARLAGTIVWGAALAALVSSAGCKDAGAPGCRIALSLQLPVTPLTQLEDARLQRAENGFVLAGLDGDNLRWGLLDVQGTLTVESALPLPPRMAQTALWFGMTSKAAPADQIVAVYLAPTDGVPNQLEARAIAQTTGGAISPPVVLFTLPPGVPANSVILSVGSSSSGMRAAVTWSVEGASESPSLLVLGADAQPAGDPVAAFKTAIANRSCLSIIPSRTEFAVSVIEPPSANGAHAWWHGVEFRDNGSRFYDVLFELEAVPTECPAIAPTPRGYSAAYKNNDGIYFTDFDTSKTVPHGDIIAGALDFGGTARIPRPACIASMGSDFAVLFDRPTGPEAWRINAFGNPQGASLFLPSMTGSVGALSTWPGKDELFATYADHLSAAAAGATDGSSTGNMRSFIRVECPMATPYISYDAAAVLDGGTDQGN